MVLRDICNSEREKWLKIYYIFVNICIREDENCVLATIFFIYCIFLINKIFFLFSLNSTF